MKLKDKAYEAHWWLRENHEWVLTNLDIVLMKVSPKSGRVVNDAKKNTRIDYWLETGPFSEPEMYSSHDYNLDCGAETFEEALVKLATLVKQFYGETSDFYGNPKEVLTNTHL